MRSPTFFRLFSAALALSASTVAFQPQGSSGVSRASSLPTVTTASSTPQRVPNMDRSCSSQALSAHFASGDDTTDTVASSASFPRMVRNRLRLATGFSFTVFRATLRGVTGISLTALYAGALAATGLWIRKAMSVFLSVFPSGFRYFLQPFLVLYYTPLIILRTLTSPNNRKRAVAKRETVLEAWKEAVVVADKTKKEGYWPVVVSDEGYFELTKPPSVGEADADDQLAEAMAATVEQAMELKSNSAAKGDSDDDDDDKK